jgi:uncharacterized membrane protein YkvA (DUF1232 family)
MSLDAFRDEYSPARLREKLAGLPPLFCRRIVREALTLYVLLREPGTPAAVRALLAAALGYLICPLDAIPDPVVPLGYLDDLAVMSVVLARLATWRNEAVRERVRELERRWAPDWWTAADD